MTDKQDDIALLRVSLAADPGGDAFVELANALADSPATRPEAREICFRGIVANPDSLRGRLTLARLFYLDGMFEFSARELTELNNFADVPALQLVPVIPVTQVIDFYGWKICRGFSAQNADGDPCRLPALKFV